VEDVGALALRELAVEQHPRKKFKLMGYVGMSYHKLTNPENIRKECSTICRVVNAQKNGCHYQYQHSAL